MSKKLISLMLVLVMLVGAFASCSSTPETETSDDGAAADNQNSSQATDDAAESMEGVEVSLGLSAGPQADDLINYIPAFEEATGISVSIESVAESGYLQKLLLSLSGNDATYDVFMSSNSMWGQILDPGWAEPLDAFIDDDSKTDAAWKDGFSTSMLDIVQRDGSRYAVTYQMGTNILYYNKAMLADAGLDPESPPSTLEEVLVAAEQIHDPDNEKYGIVFRGTREQNQNTFLWVMLWFSQGGDWYNVPDSPNIAVLDRDEAINATQFFADFHQFAPDGIANYGWEDSMLAFQQGKAAMWIDTNSLAGNVLDPESSAVYEDVGFLTLDEGKAIGAPWVFMMASNSQVKDAAWQLMQYVTGFDVTWGQTTEGINAAPARKDVLEHADIAEYMHPELAAAASKGLENAAPIYFPILSQTAEIRAELAVAISDVAAGNLTSEEAMNNTNNTIIEILERDGLEDLM